VYYGVVTAVVMPAYNVADFIERAIGAIPAYVDHIIVVDDASQDATASRIRAIQRKGLHFIQHPMNRGVGAGIDTGYAMAYKLGAQIVVVMAGDGQMDAHDLPQLLRPILENKADYVKGNRFLMNGVWRCMPKIRFFGNIVLSLLTKIATGYWKIFDSQCGFTAISRRTLKALAGKIYPGYGYPNDLLGQLKILKARVKDVAVRPIYRGQPSGIHFWTFFYPIFYLLMKAMARRIWVSTKRTFSPAFAMELNTKILRPSSRYPSRKTITPLPSDAVNNLS